MLADDAPVMEEYVPAEHGVQAKTVDWPVFVLYNPAKQLLQWEEATAPISVPYVPEVLVNKMLV